MVFNFTNEELASHYLGAMAEMGGNYTRVSQKIEGCTVSIADYYKEHKSLPPMDGVGPKSIGVLETILREGYLIAKARARVNRTFRDMEKTRERQKKWDREDKAKQRLKDDDWD